MMGRIRGKDTKPEMLVRKYLFAHGFRYRLHGRKLSGHPDLVLRKYGAVIFVHGCFWHRHEGCRDATTPSTRVDFWCQKFKSNMSRDQRNVVTLMSSGWRVAIVWECHLKRMELRTLNALEAWLKEGGQSWTSDELCRGN